MDKNVIPPKLKPPPSETSSEESSDEETEDEEQAEVGSGFDSGSDESTDTTKKKLISVLPTKQPASAKAAATPAPPAAATPGSPAKRTREANGKKEKEEEPPNKRRKPEVTTPAPRAAPKPAAQQSDKKTATKTEKAKSTPPTKEKPTRAAAADKDTKKSASKRKTTSPAPKTSASSRSEDDNQQRRKSISLPWSPDEELALSRELQKDRVNDVYGSSLPSSRAHPYWVKLMSRFSFMDKYENDQKIERLCEKVRRMRLRYEALASRIQAGETSTFKSAHESGLWRIWHTIWGPNKATPRMLNGDDESEDDEEEEEEESDEGSEEEEEIVPTQGKGRLPTVSRAPAKKKVVIKKVAVDESTSDDDDSVKEDSPVKATPPAVPAVQAGPTSAAGKHGPASKSVAKGAAVDVDTGRTTLPRAAAHNGAQGGHASIPAMIEKSVRADALPKVSDEMRAENLALLRDMRGTCVKMVEEAKAQSLLVTEKILEETRVKTTQIVEEARLKSAQIMEELRLVVERIGNIAGQNGRPNGSHGGRWSDLSDNLFQGVGLIGNGELPAGDPSNVKWREQSEAEQGLILQRLHLVQEQARIQQEGLRLMLNFQKQQASTEDKHQA